MPVRWEGYHRPVCVELVVGTLHHSLVEPTTPNQEGTLYHNQGSQTEMNKDLKASKEHHLK